jgi:hypothetical protein
MRLVLQWYGEGIDLNLFGLFQYQNHDCLASSLDSSCGGMEFKRQSPTLQVLTVNQIEPLKYLFYVTRNLDQTQALNKLLLKDEQMVNADIVLAKPRITIYVHEVTYPLIEYSLPLRKLDFDDN